MLAPRFGQLPARRGHDKNRGADPGDRRPGRGLGDLREEPPASAGGLRYELRVSRLAHGGRVWVAAETTASKPFYALPIFSAALAVAQKAHPAGVAHPWCSHSKQGDSPGPPRGQLRAGRDSKETHHGPHRSRSGLWLAPDTQGAGGPADHRTGIVTRGADVFARMAAMGRGETGRLHGCPPPDTRAAVDVAAPSRAVKRLWRPQDQPALVRRLRCSQRWRPWLPA